MGEREKKLQKVLKRIRHCTDHPDNCELTGVLTQDCFIKMVEWVLEVFEDKFDLKIEKKVEVTREKLRNAIAYATGRIGYPERSYLDDICKELGL